MQILDVLEAVHSGGALSWLKENKLQLEAHLGYPLALSGIAAAAFFDLEFSEHQASMLYLILRLPGAAAHSLEQELVPWNKFPFFGDAIELLDDPGSKGLPNLEELL